MRGPTARSAVFGLSFGLLLFSLASVALHLVDHAVANVLAVADHALEGADRLAVHFLGLRGDRLVGNSVAQKEARRAVATFRVRAKIVQGKIRRFQFEVR